jgi:hypothetical protein
MFDNEKAPIALSNNEDFVFAHDKHAPTYTLHTHHAYYNILLDANGDVPTKRCIMMDNVFIYHAHTLFLLSFVCVDMRTKPSTSIEHELAKRALESIILVSSNSNSARIPFTCYASNMLRTCSSIWFLCKHVDEFCATCDNHAPMILNIDALCVATYMCNDFLFFCFVCNHIGILVMTCHICYRFEFIGVVSNKLTNCSFFWLGCITTCDYDIFFYFWMNMICVATNMMKTCSLLWFVCTHVDDDFDILPYVFLSNSPLITSRMLITCSFQSLERNNMHIFQHEMDTMVFSNFDGVFVFPYLEDVQPICLHIDLAYAFPLLYLCCANYVVNKNGHVLHDMLPYHAHTYFA